MYKQPKILIHKINETKRKQNKVGLIYKQPIHQPMAATFSYKEKYTNPQKFSLKQRRLKNQK